MFGNMAAMPGLVALWHGSTAWSVIEDATEAAGHLVHRGTVHAGKMAGTIGDVGVYSFNGNKIITTGSGGMVVSNHPDWLEHAQPPLYTGEIGRAATIVHDEVGYNYRLTNVQAALGLAQLEQLEGFIAHKNEMYDFYIERLDGKNGYRHSAVPGRACAPTNGFTACIWRTRAHYAGTTSSRALAAAEDPNAARSGALIHEQADYPQNETLRRWQWREDYPRAASSTCRAPPT